MRGALAVVLALVCASPLLGAAPTARRYPAASVTDLGGPRLVGEIDDDATVSGVQILIGAGLERQSPRQAGLAALVTECVARTSVTVGERTLPLEDAVAAIGGSINWSVEGRFARFYLEARTSDIGPLIRLLGQALAKPDFSPPTITAARVLLRSQLSELEANPLSVGVALIRRSYYLGGAGLPALGTASSLDAFEPGDLIAFHAQYYRRGELNASVAGRAAPDLAEGLRALASGLTGGAPPAVQRPVRALSVNPQRVIARRDVGAPLIVVGFAAPAPTRRDFGAMLVIEALLSSAFERDRATTQTFPRRAVGAAYSYDAVPATLTVYANGLSVDPSAALTQILVVTKTLSDRPLPSDSLLRFKRIAAGTFVSDSVSLSARTSTLGKLAALGFGADALNAALDSLDATTSGDVQRIAKRYLQRSLVAVVLPRKSNTEN